MARAWSSVRSSAVSRLVKSEPRLALHRGRPLLAAMRHERIVEAELRTAVRDRGFAALEAVEAVVVETDGTFTVIERIHGKDSALTGVTGYASPRV